VTDVDRPRSDLELVLLVIHQLEHGIPMLPTEYAALPRGS
jgi:hypothetical protein